jgi:hypothetical protein
VTEFVLRLIHAEGGAALSTGNMNIAAELAIAATKNQIRKAEYLMWADVEAFNGRGDAVFTSKLKKARRFANFEEAFEFWRKQSVRRPLREDGLPNRPLTAFNVTIEKVP